MTDDVWSELAAEQQDHGIPRDRYLRPIVTPASGGSPRGYTRPSTLGDILDSRYRLELWGKRSVAVGLAYRPDLLALVASIDPEAEDGKQELNKVCELAIEASKAGAAANLGSALHAIAARALRGEDISRVPLELQEHVMAYLACIQRFGFTVVHVEQFVVNEYLGCGGTPDLILERDGTYYIGDYKTGEGFKEWGTQSGAIQEAVYARAETLYYWREQRHEPMPAPMDLTRGYVFHSPAGTNQCELLEIDIAAGWEAAKACVWARQWGNRNDLARSVTEAADRLLERRAWITERIMVLPVPALDKYRSLVTTAELPRVSDAASAHLDDMAELLTLVEAEWSVPFGSPDPTKPKRTRKAKTKT